MSNDSTSDNVADLDQRRQHAQVNTRRATVLDRLANEVVASERRPAEFLSAWKAGVTLTGEDYFRVTSTTVATAGDRDQLRPDFEVIEHALPAMSDGQRRFLIAMCQFYSDSGIATVCRDAGIDQPSLADLALLDDKHRSVLMRLLESYAGW